MPRGGLQIASFLVRWGSIAGMAFAAFLFLNHAQFWARATSTSGVVVGEVSSMSTTRSGGRTVGSSYSVAPEVSFETASGETFTFLSAVGYGELLKYQRGQEIPVLYLASDPETARVYSLFELFVLPVVLFFFAGVFWIVGLVLQFASEGPTRKPD